MAGTEQPGRTLVAFAAALAVIFGAAFALGRAFPDHPAHHPAGHHDG